MPVKLCLKAVTFYHRNRRLKYAPYAILNFAVPIISILFAITGFKIIYMKESESQDKPITPNM